LLGVERESLLLLCAGKGEKVSGESFVEEESGQGSGGGPSHNG
jgi:hypothetical protein